MDLAGLLERIHWLVDNSYMYWGGEVFHQQIGVAMGLIPAGLIATIVCFTYEIEFLRRCLARLNSELARDAAGAEIPKLRAKVYFALWLKRYIDDEFHTLVDAEAFDSSTALYDERTVFDGSQDGTDADGIYPTSSTGPGGVVVDAPCELEAVSRPTRSATFCDWRFTIDPIKRRVTSTVYDKRQDMPMFRGCRTFPHRDSMIHLPAKLNVITSQFMRYARRSSSMTAFVAACANLVFLMNRHGYDDGKVRRKVYHFRHHWHTCGAERLGRWATFYDRFRDELIRLLQRR